MNGMISYILVGFTAQMISGTLGMAYGVSGILFLLSMGLPASIASASIHAATVVTSFASGVSHLYAGNVNKKLLIKLLVPGALGGVFGAVLLTQVNGVALRPFVYTYLFFMGIRIIHTALNGQRNENETRRRRYTLVSILAGMFDALGGGGWGPIMTTSLISSGEDLHKIVGTVNASKFIVALSQVLTFSFFLQITHWQVIIGLIIGGVIASPISAWLCQKMNPKMLMLILGIVIALVSGFSLVYGLIG